MANNKMGHNKKKQVAERTCCACQLADERVQTVAVIIPVRKSSGAIGSSTLKVDLHPQCISDYSGGTA
jgi:hypothetical protein